MILYPLYSAINIYLLRQSFQQNCDAFGASMFAKKMNVQISVCVCVCVYVSVCVRLCVCVCVIFFIETWLDAALLSDTQKHGWTPGPPLSGMVGGPSDRRTDARGRTDGDVRTDGRGRTPVRTDGLTDGRMDGWTDDGRSDRRVNGRAYELTDGRMNGRTDGLTS